MSGRARSAAVAVVVALLTSGACLERGKKKKNKKTEPRDAAVATPAAEPLAPRADPAGPADPGATIRVRLEADPPHLNPLLGDALAARILLGDVYEGLVCRARPLETPRPCLATRWAITEGGRRWRFELRSGVRFHDGRPLSAADVIVSLELAARSAAPTVLRADFDDLVSATADGDAVVIKFAGHRPGRLEAFARLPILSRQRFARAAPARLASHPASLEPIGTGPLRFESYRRGEHIALRRNPDYWGRSARAARVIYSIVASQERTAALLAADRLDLAPQLPLREARDLAAGDRDLDLYSYHLPSYLAAVYNVRRPVLSTAPRRRALTGLLDRDELSRALFDDRAAPITGPFVGADVDPGVEPIRFDRGAARRALPEKASLELLYPAESRTMAQIADIWASDAAGIIELLPRPAPYAAVLERARSGDFDVVLLAFTTGPDLDMYHRLHSSQIGGENIGGLRDPVLDERLEQARAAADPEGRQRHTRAVHRRIAELQPYGFIASDVRGGVVRRDIGGVAAGDGLAARFLWKQR